VAQPIQIILDDPNYILWAQTMSSFLKGRKLWWYITGGYKKPIKLKNETDEKYNERLDD